MFLSTAVRPGGGDIDLYSSSLFHSQIKEYLAVYKISVCLCACLFVCVEGSRPCQQLRSCRAGQLPINTVPGQV